MSELLDRINRAVDGLCPCGAEPSPGSAYCSDDCTPTHIAGDTDLSGAGEYGAQPTPMRWRPDLVTAQDDSNLELVTTGRRGRYNAHLYRYPTGPGMLHLRLDDGHRYVGVDINDESEIDTEHGFEPTWQRLERELGNSRHLEPDPDPWADAWGSLYGELHERHRTRAEEREQRFVAHLNGFAAGAISAGQAVTYRSTDEPPVASPGRIFFAPLSADPNIPSGWTELGELTEDGISHTAGWDSPDSNPLADIRSLMQRSVTASFPMTSEQVHSLMQSFNRAGDALRNSFSGVIPPHAPAPEHPMLAAIEARRHRNTGPGHQPRAPRQINPRRGR